MRVVSDAVIDSVLDELEEYDETEYERQVSAFAREQPYLFAYLHSEDNFHLLTEEEKGYVQYLGLVVWLSVSRVNGTLPLVESEQIGVAEERNYERIETASGRGFEDRIAVFYEHTDQEALLNFAVEAVMEEEGEQDLVVTPEGREIIFVAVKTVIDVLTDSA